MLPSGPQTCPPGASESAPKRPQTESLRTLTHVIVAAAAAAAAAATAAVVVADVVAGSRGQSWGPR